MREAVVKPVVSSPQKLLCCKKKANKASLRARLAGCGVFILYKKLKRRKCGAHLNGSMYRELHFVMSTHFYFIVAMMLMMVLYSCRGIPMVLLDTFYDLNHKEWCFSSTTCYFF